MATFEFKMEGIEELENDLREAIEDCPKELKKDLMTQQTISENQQEKEHRIIKTIKVQPKVKIETQV